MRTEKMWMIGFLPVHRLSNLCVSNLMWLLKCSGRLFAGMPSTVLMVAKIVCDDLEQLGFLLFFSMVVCWFTSGNIYLKVYCKAVKAIIVSCVPVFVPFTVGQWNNHLWATVHSYSLTVIRSCR